MPRGPLERNAPTYRVRVIGGEVGVLRGVGRDVEQAAVRALRSRSIPAQMWQGMSPVPAQTWQGGAAHAILHGEPHTQRCHRAASARWYSRVPNVRIGTSWIHRCCACPSGVAETFNATPKICPSIAQRT